MKKIALFILFIFLFSAHSSAEQLLMSRPRSMQEVDRSKLYDYKYRLRQRKTNALEARRVYNSGKTHKYWTAIVYPRYYPLYYRYVPAYRVERSEYKYDYQYNYGY